MRLMDIVNMKNIVAIVMLLMQLEIHGKESNLQDIDLVKSFIKRKQIFFSHNS